RTRGSARGRTLRCGRGPPWGLAHWATLATRRVLAEPCGRASRVGEQHAPRLRSAEDTFMWYLDFPVGCIWVFSASSLRVPSAASEFCTQRATARARGIGAEGCWWRRERPRVAATRVSGADRLQRILSAVLLWF